MIGTANFTKLENGVTVIEPSEVTGQFISMKRVLKIFLELPGFLQIVLNYINYLEHEANPNFLTNIIQGSVWANIKEKYPGKILIPVSINYDGYETKNPLGSHSGVQSLGAVYLMILTLPPQFQASLKNIFLTLLFHDKDREEFGTRACFRKLLKELTDLEIKGLMINGIRIHFVCVLVTGDNLGVHKICGFVEGFSANYPCIKCKVKKDVLQKQITENENLLRAVDNYEADLKKNNVSETGINGRCIWNELPSFHITKNVYYDMMHDFDEGAAQYGLIALILHYVKQKVFTFEELNDRIQCFNYGPLEINKVPFLKKDKLENGKLGISASETKTLIKYFGLIIGDLIPLNDKHWQLYICLREINDILSSRCFYKDCLLLLKKLISEHHRIYVNVFKLNLKPKHHNLLHYYSFIMSMGPAINVSCMRTEAKHRPSKVAAHLSNSCVNLPLTVAKKHQLQQCYNFMCKDSLISKTEFGSTQILSLFEIERFQNLFPNGFASDSIIHSTSWITINNITYKPYMVVLESTNDYVIPIFSQITDILINSKKQSIFVLKKFETIKFSSHFCAYEVLPTTELTSANVETLLNKFPTGLQNTSDGNYFVVCNDY